MENLGVFKSKDFYSGVILLVLGFELLDVERSLEKFCLFVFSDPEGRAGEMVDRYWKRELRVDPRLMADSINELKTRLHSRS